MRTHLFRPVFSAALLVTFMTATALAQQPVFRGKVVRFTEDGRKIPHMGWNAANPVNLTDPLWEGLGSEPYFYFVHSFFPVPADESIIATTTEYGEVFASAIRSGAVLGCQFHPEKSQQAGLRLLGNFLGVEVPVSA